MCASIFINIAAETFRVSVWKGKGGIIYRVGSGR
jgi:hypothetical protein